MQASSAGNVEKEKEKEKERRPSCAHGPTLLFQSSQRQDDVKEVEEDGSAAQATSRSYYACSAYRDRRLCSFFQWADEWDPLASSSSTSSAPPQAAQPVPPPSSQALQATRGGVRLSGNAKGLAQFMFDAAALDLLAAACVRLPHRVSDGDDVDPPLRVRRVLCLGTPRLHERLLQLGSAVVASLLLDLDHRFAPFFGSTFVRFNMGNAHFFDAADEAKVAGFMAAGCDCIVLDPPYGMLVSSLVATLRALSRLARPPPLPPPPPEVVVADGLGGVSVMWLCPFYYEDRIKASLPCFHMLDYQVGYDNHPLFNRATPSKTRQRRARRGRGDKFAFSPVRIFTNIAANAFVLPEAEGYRLCPACDRYVCRNNRHCDACGKCTSKDGRKWSHCDACGLCVPPGRVHCDTCGRCDLPEHVHASAGTERSVGCFTCGATGHKRRACPTTASAKKKKRKTKRRKTTHTSEDPPPRAQSDGGHVGRPEDHHHRGTPIAGE